MHCLVFLHPDDRARLLIPSNINYVVRAELPDQEMDPDRSLRAIIEVCSKKFPKAFAAETTITEDGYPIYRRRNIPGQSFTKTYAGGQKTFCFDNR